MPKRPRARASVAVRWLKSEVVFVSVLAVVFLVFFRLGTIQLPTHQHTPPAQGFAEVPLVAHFFLDDSVSRSTYLRTSDTATAQDIAPRAKIWLFIGIFTAAKGVDSKFGQRRTAIRKTWLPVAQSLDDTVVRFVVGRDTNPTIQHKLQREMDQFQQQFLPLDVDDCDGCLADKLTEFLLAVDAAYDARWILKVDDDVYLSPLRLPPVVAQWDLIGAHHTGCFHHGAVPPGAAEAAAQLLAGQYPLHAHGPVFAVRGDAARSVLRRNAPALRRFGSDGVTLGMWLLAFNVTWFEDARLCERLCRQAAVAFQDVSCRGLCNPLADIVSMHGRKGCSSAPEPGAPARYLPSQSASGAFDAMQVP